MCRVQVQTADDEVKINLQSLERISPPTDPIAETPASERTVPKKYGNQASSRVGGVKQLGCARTSRATSLRRGAGCFRASRRRA